MLRFVCGLALGLVAGTAFDLIAFVFDYVEHQGEDFATIEESSAGVESFRPLPKSASNFHLRWDEDTRHQILAFDFDPNVDRCSWLDDALPIDANYLAFAYVPLPRYERAPWWPAFLRESLDPRELREAGLRFHRRFHVGPRGSERMSAFDVFYAVDCDRGRAFSWIDRHWCSCEKASIRAPHHGSGALAP